MPDPVAIAALGVSAVSLTWQGVAWWLSGERIRVKPHFEGSAEGYEVLVVDVHNSGRGPAQVTEAELVVMTPNGADMQGGMHLAGKEVGDHRFPVTVPGRSRARLSFDAAKTCHSIKHHATLPAPGYVELKLGSGRHARSRWWEPLPVDAVAGEDPMEGAHEVRLVRQNAPRSRPVKRVPSLLRRLRRTRTPLS